MKSSARERERWKVDRGKKDITKKEAGKEE